MENKQKKPSIFSTWLEMFKFKLDPEHKIPLKHHLNLAALKGCNLKELTLYISYENQLSDEAIDMLIAIQNETVLLTFLRYYQYSLSDMQIEAFEKKIGIKTLLKNNIVLTKRQTMQFIQKNSRLMIKQYLHLLSFDADTEAALLQLSDMKLTILYLQHHRIRFCNYQYILRYDAAEIYAALPLGLLCPNGFAAKVINEKPIDAVKAFFERCSNLEYEDETALIDKDDDELFKVYLGKHNLSERAILHLVQNGCDKMFCTYIRFGNHNIELPEVYERLFLQKNRELLEEYLKNYILPENFEVRLFELNDSKLTELYLSNGFDLSPKTIVWLMEHNQDEILQKQLEGCNSIGYYAEAALFKSGERKRILAYIAERELSSFSEAMLVKYADSDIIKTYAKGRILAPPAQQAFVLRKDNELLRFFLTENEGVFDDEFMLVFLANADTEIILAYFNNRIQKFGNLGLSDFCCDYCEENLEIIVLKREDEKLIRLLIENETLNTDAEIWLMRYGKASIVAEYFNNNILCPEAEYALIGRGDKKLISDYIEIVPFVSETSERILMSLLDEELVKLYEDKYSFNDEYQWLDA